MAFATTSLQGRSDEQRSWDLHLGLSFALAWELERVEHTDGPSSGREELRRFEFLKALE